MKLSLLIVLVALLPVLLEAGYAAQIVADPDAVPYRYTGRVEVPEAYGSGTMTGHELVVSTAAHVVYDDSRYAWSEWMNWREKGVGPDIEIRSFRYFGTYGDAVSDTGGNSPEAFNQDFALGIAYEPLAPVPPPARVAAASAGMMSSASKMIVGFPGGLYDWDDYRGDRMHRAGPFATPFTREKGEYLIAEDVSLGPGGSGGGIWIQEDGEWSWAGVYVSGREPVAGSMTGLAGVVAFEGAKQTLLEELLAGLEAAGPPRIPSSVPAEVVVDSGEELILELEFEGFPPPKVTWWKRSASGPEQEFFHSEDSEGSTLIRIAPDSLWLPEAEVRLELSNAYGTVSTDWIRLKYADMRAPEILALEGDWEGFWEQDAFLKVSFSAAPAPEVSWWVRSAGANPHELQSRPLVRGGEDLFRIPAKSASWNEAEFKVVLTNAAGMAASDWRVFRYRDGRAPSFGPVPAEISMPAGQDVTYPIPVDAFPQPWLSVRVERDGGYVFEGLSEHPAFVLEDNTLRLLADRPELKDAVIQFKARNALGEASSGWIKIDLERSALLTGDYIEVPQELVPKGGVAQFAVSAPEATSIEWQIRDPFAEDWNWQTVDRDWATYPSEGVIEIRAPDGSSLHGHEIRAVLYRNYDSLRYDSVLEELAMPPIRVQAEGSVQWAEAVWNLHEKELSIRTVGAKEAELELQIYEAATASWRPVGSTRLRSTTIPQTSRFSYPSTSEPYSMRLVLRQEGAVPVVVETWEVGPVIALEGEDLDWSVELPEEYSGALVAEESVVFKTDNGVNWPASWSLWYASIRDGHLFGELKAIPRPEGVGEFAADLVQPRAGELVVISRYDPGAVGESTGSVFVYHWSAAEATWTLAERIRLPELHAVPSSIDEVKVAGDDLFVATRTQTTLLWHLFEPDDAGRWTLQHSFSLADAAKDERWQFRGTFIHRLGDRLLFSDLRSRLAVFDYDASSGTYTRVWRGTVDAVIRSCFDGLLWAPERGRIDGYEWSVEGGLQARVSLALFPDSYNVRAVPAVSPGDGKKAYVWGAGKFFWAYGSDGLLSSPMWMVWPAGFWPKRHGVLRDRLYALCEGDGRYALAMTDLRGAWDEPLESLPPMLRTDAEGGGTRLIFRLPRDGHRTARIFASEGLQDWVPVPEAPSLLDPDHDGDGLTELHGISVPATGTRFYRLEESAAP